MIKIGVISDTHGFLDPKVTEYFAGVDHILHGGDIGSPHVIADLERIAPVTAVLGNNDAGLSFRETEVLELGKRKFLVHHIVDPKFPAEAIKGRIAREKPDVVVFGHSHKPFSEAIGTTLYFNPGYAGKPRFNLERTIAMLFCDKDAVRTKFLNL